MKRSQRRGLASPARTAGSVRGVLLALGGVAVLAVVIGIAAFLHYRHFTVTPLNIAAGPEPETIALARGTTFKDVVRELRRRGISRAAPLWWRILGRETQAPKRLHAGEYALVPGMTPRDLVDHMIRGEVLQHHFTIVDGWTFAQVRAALAAVAGLQHTLDAESDADIATALGIAGGQPEGWFRPETYSWVKGDSDLDLLRQAHAAMVRVLDRLWAGRDADVAVKSPYEALILASLVEKETARPEERPEIAGVFERRLKLGMRLQTDPSVIYGIGSAYDGRIHTRDLERDTPYNTYTRGGLPPTPIALPGDAAIEAVLHPAGGDALYFVARGDGTHQFSATLAEHNRAVARYQLHRNP